MAPKKLTRRQKVFVEYYFQYWNATQAAREAGYQNPNKAAYTLVRQELVKQEIASRLKELRMSADEVLTRLSQQACLNAAEFFVFEDKQQEDADGKISRQLVMTDVNWQVFRERGYLVKKLSYDRRGNPVLEFHDAQTALIQLGRAHGLFLDRLEQNGNLRVNLTADDLAKARDQAKSYERDLLNGADQRQDTGANQ
jgi:hypothetical protein